MIKGHIHPAALAFWEVMEIVYEECNAWCLCMAVDAVKAMLYKTICSTLDIDNQSGSALFITSMLLFLMILEFLTSFVFLLQFYFIFWVDVGFNWVWICPHTICCIYPKSTPSVCNTIFSICFHECSESSLLLLKMNLSTTRVNGIFHSLHLWSSCTWYLIRLYDFSIIFAIVCQLRCLLDLCL